MNEEDRIINATDLSDTHLIERVFTYEEPRLPKALVTEEWADENQIRQALLRHITHAKEVRLLGFDHRVDPQIRDAYQLAAENGAKVRLVYHPDYITFRQPDSNADYDAFLEMIEKLPNSEMCPIQPEKEKFSVKSQADGPLLSMGVTFENNLYHSIKAVDKKLLVVTHHFIGTDKGPLTEIIEQEEGIPGIEAGFHSVFDQFFTENPPFESKPHRFNVAMTPGDGHTHIVNYK